jgi:phosphatidylserine decarboxylase
MVFISLNCCGVEYRMHLSATDRLFVTLQRCIPARLIGRLVYSVSRSRVRWLKNSLIRAFSRLYKVDIAEAAAPVPQGYSCFNDFFIRELRPGTRPIDAEPDSAVAPADGTIAQLGSAENGLILQAKGHSFSAAELLADSDLATELAQSRFMTIYLAPYNYHRIHMPIEGTLEQTRFIPGRLYSVNARTAATVPNLYAVNERLVCQFASPAGRFALVLVGAMNVASISTAWSGEILPDKNRAIINRRFPITEQPQLAKGDYMGHFNMGSTVIMLGPSGLTNWTSVLAPGDKIEVGQLIGNCVTSA